MREPLVRIGISEGKAAIGIRLNGSFMHADGPFPAERLEAHAEGGQVIAAFQGREIRGERIRLVPGASSTFTLGGVEIGKGFHWAREEEQTFGGLLEIAAGPRGLTVVNEIKLEEYLQSVISSEMSAAAPLEFLKAHAIASRSWLGRMLMKEKRPGALQASPAGPEIIKWYDREDHDHFDVCADDHCQRYQGITRIISENATRAVAETYGTFLVHSGRICDARYYKCCGGITENFSSAWEDAIIPYLSSIADSEKPYSPILSEADAQIWINSRPDAFCNTRDRELIARILPDYDRGTEFFRWTVAYGREELEKIILEKSGIDFGTLKELVPLERGPSGRIVRLRVKGSRQEAVVGKELEIRRWLSPSHLLSSAFVVHAEYGRGEAPVRFIFKGAGWGHGVGLCQIGAAVMASRGCDCARILGHYFPGAMVKKLYEAHQ